MNERDIPEVKALMAEWIQEVEKLTPLEVETGTLGNSLDRERIALEKKYRKLIDEAIKKHSSD